ncbi:hypothetical protein Dimus_021179 [Dionaea muscipula]
MMKRSLLLQFCGACLVCGWNVQEHTVYFIARLLSPLAPSGYDGPDSHLIAYAPMLNVLLVGISSVDCVQIFSLHGLVGPLTAYYGVHLRHIFIRHRMLF